MNSTLRKFALAASFMLAIPVAACAKSGGETPSASAATKPATLTVEQTRARLQSAPKPLLVDVREPSEFKEGHIDGARLAPLGSVTSDLKDVPKDKEILLICRSGRRSADAQQRLSALGYTNTRNVEGGMKAWESAGFPVTK